MFLPRTPILSIIGKRICGAPPFVQVHFCGRVKTPWGTVGFELLQPADYRACGGVCGWILLGGVVVTVKVLYLKRGLVLW